MLISKEEMETLMIVGTYMDAPAKMLEGMWGLSLKKLLEFEFLKYNKELTSLRLTEAGAEILLEIGIKVKTGTRVIGRTLERRHQGVQVAMLLSELGIDVFLKDLINGVVVEPAYLSSAQMRRQGYKNMLGRPKAEYVGENQRLWFCSQGIRRFTFICSQTAG
jgi:hypothetical protein